MNIRNIFCLYFVLLIVAESGSQEPELYYKYYAYDYALNPAITGRDYYPVVNFSHCKYWYGVNDSPTTTAVGTTMRLGRFNFYNPKMLLNKSNLFSRSRMGAGAFVLQEQNGPLSYLHSGVNYAYFIPVTNDGDELSFGLSAQVFHYTINASELKPVESGDMNLMNLDNQPFIPEASFGVYFHNYQLSVGASINNLLKSDVKLTSDYDLKNKRDFFVHLGYRFFFTYFELEPSLLTGQIDNGDLYYYSQLKAYYAQYGWMSFSYASTKLVAYSLGLRLNRFQMVYRYELGLEEGMSKNFQGSHEIMFGMNIGLYEAEGIRKLAK